MLGDFNGDGNLDAAVVGPTALGQKDVVRIFLGNGDGTFSPAKSYPAGISPHAIAAADFNGDGTLDLAIAAPNVSILVGNGDGTFQPPVAFRVRGHPDDLIVADFNHDGKPDVATIETINGSSFISILLNTTQFPTGHRSALTSK